MKTSLWVGLLIAVLFFASKPSQVLAQADMPSDVVADRLATARFFAIGGVGISGRRSTGQSDYQEVLSRPTDEALKTFEHVFAAGNSAGRAYALLGIHKLSPERFKYLYASLASPGESVSIMRGCIGGSESLSRIAKSIDDGYYDGSSRR